MNQKGSGEETILVFVFVVFLVILVIGIVSFVYTDNAPCSELGNMSVQNLPSRCLKELQR